MEKTLIQKHTCIPMFTAELFMTAKTRKQPKCLLMDEWIKRCGVYTHTHTHTHTQEYYLAIKKNEMMPFAHG